MTSDRPHSTRSRRRPATPSCSRSRRSWPRAAIVARAPVRRHGLVAGGVFAWLRLIRTRALRRHSRVGGPPTGSPSHRTDSRSAAPCRRGCLTTSSAGVDVGPRQTRAAADGRGDQRGRRARGRIQPARRGHLHRQLDRPVDADRRVTDRDRRIGGPAASGRQCRRGGRPGRAVVIADRVGAVGPVAGAEQVARAGLPAGVGSRPQDAPARHHHRFRPGRRRHRRTRRHGDR